MIQSIKSILVGLTEEGDGERSSALGYSLSLARTAEAHLTVQAGSLRLALTQGLVSDFGTGLIGAENRRLSSLAAEVAERVRADAALAGVACAVETPHLSYGDLRDAFLTRARVHDLSVMDAEAYVMDTDRGLIDALLFDSGRPTLIVPAGCDTFSARRVIVAWDGGAQAARALADALPILRAAETVEVVSVVGEKDLASPVIEVAPHLARHGVNASAKSVPAGRKGVATTLREEVGLFRADLLVIGAYRHSRLREWLLGGVTQSLLGSCPVPLFMSLTELARHTPATVSAP